MAVGLARIFIQIYTGIKNLRNPANFTFSFAQALALLQVDSCGNAIPGNNGRVC